MFKNLSQLSHRIAAGRNTQDIVYESLDELLSEILAGKVALRKLSGS